MYMSHFNRDMILASLALISGGVGMVVGLAFGWPAPVGWGVGFVPAFLIFAATILWWS